MLDPDNRSLPVDLAAKDIGLELGQPARAAAVLGAERQITVRFAEHGYPLARVPDRKVIVDHAQRSMTVTYTVNPGPLAGFGKVRVSGAKKISERYIRNRVTWRTGDRFRPARTGRYAQIADSQRAVDFGEDHPGLDARRQRYGTDLD